MQPQRERVSPAYSDAIYGGKIALTLGISAFSYRLEETELKAMSYN